MILLPKKIKLVGKRRAALVPSKSQEQTEFGLLLTHSVDRFVHDYKRMIVVAVTDDVNFLGNSDEVLVDMNQTKKTTLSGWSDEYRSLYSIDLYIIDTNEILAQYEK